MTQAMASSNSSHTQKNDLWGGRFSGGIAAVMQAINNSPAWVQLRLAPYDVQGSIAHANMLIEQQIIDDIDGLAILQGLQQIAGEVLNGTFPYRAEYEDIHMNVEMRLREIIGDAAGRLHTARSRNDQVITSFRLWLRAACNDVAESITELQQTLRSLAAEHVETIMPGCTHLQPAQPVSFAHHLLAYVEMLTRDASRIQDCQMRLNESPLGAAALAGTPFPIDREHTAKALQFTKPMANSLDAVASRDMVIEFLSTLAICGTHLSRLAEELILWSTPAYGFICLSDSFSTGSSIMPQKRNPDAAELIRGYTGRLNGALVNILTVMKALPLAYNKDLQDDKEITFQAFDALQIMLAAMTGMFSDITINKTAMAAACDKGYLTATDLADWLVMKLNMPFRDAHHITGQIVALAEQQNKQLHELTLMQMQTVHTAITFDIFRVLNPLASLNSRTSYGGTAPSQVQTQLKNV